MLTTEDLGRATLEIAGRGAAKPALDARATCPIKPPAPGLKPLPAAKNSDRSKLHC